ncbi:hypothetical protein IAT38_002225 [Cryptococcus sp. DSM 104549]
MGKYYCDYCDIYLTHDSMSARKAHNTGRNHIANVRDYFASLGHNQAQSLIDQILQQHENGGRNQMMMAPSMRLGAGFMNPVATQPGHRQAGNFPPQFQNGPPPMGGYPPQNGAPPFRPPFPPNGAPPYGGAPPFPPNGANGSPMPPMGMGMPPFRPPMQPTMNGSPAGSMGSPAPGGVGMPPQGGAPQGMGMGGQQAAPQTYGAPPQAASGGAGPGAAPGIHPDRLRMLGQ